MLYWNISTYIRWVQFVYLIIASVLKMLHTNCIFRTFIQDCDASNMFFLTKFKGQYFHLIKWFKLNIYFESIFVKKIIGSWTQIKYLSKKKLPSHELLSSIRLVLWQETKKRFYLFITSIFQLLIVSKRLSFYVHNMILGAYRFIRLWSLT